MPTFTIESLTEDKHNLQFFDALNNIIKEKAPYGKVLILSTESDFCDFGKVVVDVLKRLGNKTINYIVDNQFVTTIRTTCGLFCAPEDVRLIISLSDKLTTLKKYFASIRDLPSISISREMPINYFSKRAFIKTEKTTDFIETLLNDTLLCINEADLASVYAHIITLKFGLFDYYIKTLFNSEKFDLDKVMRAKSLLDLSEKLLLDNEGKESVNQALDFVQSVSESFSYIFEENFISLICQLTDNHDNVKNLIYIDYALDLFCDVEKKEHILKTTDCVKIAELVRAIFGVDEFETLKALKKQKQLIKTENYDLILNTAIKTRDYIKNALKTYQKLGGKNKNITYFDIEKIRLSGCTPYGINLLSVYREIYQE